MTRRNVRWAAAALLLIVLQLLLQACAARIARENLTLNLTLSAPLSAEQIADARTWEESDANAQGFSASYWGEKTAEVSTDFGSKAGDVRCIGFDGAAQDCLPADYLQGTAPGAAGRQCAVSAALAWALFGSSDITGQTLTLDRTDYFICGVFQSEKSILLYPAQSGFTRAALRGASADTPKADAEQWAAAVGAGQIKAIDYGPQKAWLARMACTLPAALVGLALVAALLRFILNLPGVWRGLGCFALALAFAWAVPRFLQTLPGWLIPGRWSSFSFWPELFRKITRG